MWAEEPVPLKALPHSIQSVVMGRTPSCRTANQGCSVGMRLRSQAIGASAVSFCVSGAAVRHQVLASGARRVSGGDTTLGRAGCQEKMSVDAHVPMSWNRTRLIELCNDLFPLPTERGKNEVTMARVHGTIRFRAWTARLCVGRRKEDT